MKPVLPIYVLGYSQDWRFLESCFDLIKAHWRVQHFSFRILCYFQALIALRPQPLGPEILNANFSLSSNYSPFNLLIMQTSLKTNCYILTISLTSLKTNFYTLDNCSLNNYSCNIAPLFLPWSKGIPSRMPCIESITNHGYGYHYALFFICLL